MIDYEAKGVTTRGEKTTTQDAENNDTNVRTEEPLAENHDKPVESNEILTNDQPQKTNEPGAQPSNKIQTPPIPFPRRLRKEKEEAQQKKFLENLMQLHINMPFIEALAQMPKYAKFLKGLLTNKARLEEVCMITMNESIGDKEREAMLREMSNINGISPSYCTHKILIEDDFKPVIQPQRRLNPKVQDVVKNEIVKLLDSDLIYPISDSSWVSPIHVVPKKGGTTVVLNDNNELIPSRTVTRSRVCIDYRKLNDATRKDHFPFPLSIRCWSVYVGMNITTFLMNFQDSSKFQSPPKIKKRQHSPVLMGLLLTEICLLGYATHLLPSKDA
ncbi:hypothetical protein Tco_0425267 [Tanacetum coccineum]